MRWSLFSFYLFPLISLFPLHASANIQLSLQSSVAINQPATVTWTRAAGDPVNFSLQSILFSTTLSNAPDIESVNTTDNVLTGTIQLISRFAGPHIIVALSPVSQSGLIATSNQFQVLDSTSTASSSASASLTASTVTVTLTASPTSGCNATQSDADVVDGPSKCQPQTGVIVGGIVASIGIICIALVLVFFLRRSGKRPNSEEKSISSSSSSRRLWQNPRTRSSSALTEISVDSGFNDSTVLRQSTSTYPTANRAYSRSTAAVPFSLSLASPMEVEEVSVSTAFDFQPPSAALTVNSNGPVGPSLPARGEVRRSPSAGSDAPPPSYSSERLAERGGKVTPPFVL